MKFAIVVSRWNGEYTSRLERGAREAFAARGADVDAVVTFQVPGAFELPFACQRAAKDGDFDAVIALGVVIRGETYHFEVVSNESARGIMALTLDGLAIGNGILTVENEEQALVRADPAQKDKGGEAAKAAIALLELRNRFA